MKTKLYYIYFCLTTFFKAVGMDSHDPVYVIVFAIGCAVVFLKVATEKYTVRELVSMAVIIVIGILNWLIGGFSPVLVTAIALCGLKGVDADELIKFSFWIRLFAFVTMIVLSTTGLIEHKIISFYRDGELLHRYSFGYGHPNTSHMMFAIIVALSLYAYGKKMRIIHYGVLVLFNQLLFSFTYSRTGSVIVWASIIIYWLLQIRRLPKLIQMLCKCSYILFFAGTLWLGFNYQGNALLAELDMLLTGRLYYVDLLLTEEVPSLFGHEEYTDLIIDNGYLEVLYNGGILAFLWFSFYYCRMLRRFVDEERRNALFLIIVFLIFNLSESHLELVAVNVSLVFIGEFIFKKGRNQIVEHYNLHTDLQPGE